MEESEKLKEQSTILRIDQKTVHLQTETLHTSLGLAIFSAEYFNSFPSSGVLPPSVRWISRSGRAFIVERPPFKHRVVVTTYGDSRFYEIPVPWTIFGIEFDENHSLNELYLFYRYAPIAHEQDELYRCYLPNLYTNGRVCGASYKPRVTDVGTAIYGAIQSFWLSGFNDEIEPIFETVPLELRDVIAKERIVGTHTHALFAALERYSLPEILGFHMVQSKGFPQIAHLIERLESPAPTTLKDFATSLFRKYEARL